MKYVFNLNRGRDGGVIWAGRSYPINLVFSMNLLGNGKT